jgi:hypothetical protein
LHRNAPLTPEGRLRLCERIESGWTVAATADSMNVSPQTAHTWWGRYQVEGVAGLIDRSSRPRSCPHRTRARVERRIVALRQSRKLGPARLAGIVNVPPATEGCAPPVYPFRLVLRAMRHGAVPAQCVRRPEDVDAYHVGRTGGRVPLSSTATTRTRSRRRPSSRRVPITSAHSCSSSR